MPANGWPMPHSRFWIARAKANASRPQPWATDIGSRKKPKVERTPKPIRAIRQPQTMMTVGVRQDGPEMREAEDGEDMGRALRAVCRFSRADYVVGRRASNSLLSCCLC